MKYLIPLVAIVGLAACGNPETYSNQETLRKARACITAGGIPSFTTSRDGGVELWIGCMMPVEP